MNGGNLSTMHLCVARLFSCVVNTACTQNVKEGVARITVPSLTVVTLPWFVAGYG